MWKWIAKHKKLSIILFAIIGLGFPVLVNFFSQYEAKYNVISQPSDWLLFWGTYLAAIASLGMIIITSFSIHKNSLENNRNRITQRNLMLFQVDNHNLNLFKESSIELCESYGYNNLVHVCNIFIQDNKSPLEYIKLLMTNVANKHKLFLMNILPKASGMLNLLCEEEKIYKFYNEVLMDLEVVTSYMQFSSNHILSNIVSDRHSSKILSQIIAENISHLKADNPKKWLNKILNLRLDVIDPNYIEPLWAVISEVYLNEKNRIGKYLIGHGTEQDK